MNHPTLYHLAALSFAPTPPAHAETATPPTQKVSTPAPGTVLRKAILAAMRAEVAADQKRKQPNEKFPRAVFTPQHFRGLGDWAFVQATMIPIYGEEGGIFTVLKKEKGSWKVITLHDNFFFQRESKNQMEERSDLCCIASGRL